MKKAAKILIHLSVFLILIMPAVSLAYKLGDSIVPPCSTDAISGQCIWGFNEFLTLINNVISFILFGLAVPVAAIMFFYAGFLLITAGEEAAHARTKAKSIFMNALIGLAVAAGAWLIVKTILSILGYDGAWIGL